MTSPVNNGSHTVATQSLSNHVLTQNRTIQKCILAFLYKHGDYKDLVSFSLSHRMGLVTVLGRHSNLMPILRELVKQESSICRFMTAAQFYTYQNQFFPNVTSFPEILSLKLTALPAASTNDSVTEIAEKCPKLQSLDLEGATQLTNTSLDTIHSLRELKALNLSGCGRITRIKSLSPLSRLFYLNLSRCLKLKDLIPMTCFKELSALDLSQNHKITPKQLNALIGTQICSLNLSYCPGVTDAGCDAIKTLPLKQILLQGCYQLTGEKFDSLPDTLTDLNLALCQSIQDDNWTYLGNLANLKYLCLAHCRQLKVEHLQFLTKLKKLQKLDLTGCVQITDADLPALLELPIPLILINLTSVSSPNIASFYATKTLRNQSRLSPTGKSPSKRAKIG